MYTYNLDLTPYPVKVANESLYEILTKNAKILVVTVSGWGGNFTWIEPLANGGLEDDFPFQLGDF